MSDLDNNENIVFFLEEKDVNKNNEEEIEKMMKEFVTLSEDDEIHDWGYNDDTSNYGNDELFYEEYTVKDLLKICSYYGLDKDIRSSKCKKQDIISTIVYFERMPENFEIVEKRNRMWAYITELLNDPKMKKYIIFN